MSQQSFDNKIWILCPHKRKRCNVSWLETRMNNTSETDVPPWCYKWIGYGRDGIGWYPGGVKYRAPYGANKFEPTSLPNN